MGKGVDRRAIVAGVGAAAVSLAAGEGARAADRRKRYAIVGVGHRSRMYQDAIWGRYKGTSELVAIADLNPGRLAYCQARAKKAGAAPPRPYAHTDFERMIRETRPDYVIVTTVDASHDDYLVRALAAGCDVITEKPMTTTPAKAQRILDACRTSGRNVRVTFNYRYTPPRTQVKDLLMSGEIGDILSVDFNWLLNTNHGADYFRRWHSHKASSGGLMVHKATHHFDLVNWWLSAVPETVLAYGKKEFYTPATARRMGLAGAHERCLTCPEKAKCGFYLDLAADPSLKALYLENERYDGYFRDQCVWRPEIDIEDTMNVIVKYDTGATLSYSLNACNAWEGYTIAFNGTKGRLEHQIVEQVYVAGGDMVQGGIEPGGVSTRVMPLRGAARAIEPWKGEGGHGGGDDLMLADIFAANPEPDRYLRASDHRSGAWSVLIGAAANQAFQTGGPVRIADLVTGLERPAYPAMPTRNDPVPMPPRRSRA
ncbi:Gfo/Idh/MocA family oxidoreductase [Phenylobacterium sp.]|uniref:Gfo/Idh/MocA family protein n=1 Tax=Phenylobacterium sp. TaxID=1871053 RepID=UPI002F921E13